MRLKIPFIMIVKKCLPKEKSCNLISTFFLSTFSFDILHYISLFYSNYLQLKHCLGEKKKKKSMTIRANRNFLYKGII